MQAISNKQLDSEHQLWRDAVKGDTSAFEKIVVRHQSAVSAVAFSIIGDFSSSQDIAQETFWAAWTTRDRLRDSNRLGAWLCGIARNLARQWRRKKTRAKEVEDSKTGYEPQSSFSDPVDQFISDEEESVVWKTLEKIPDNYREVLVLYYRQGESIEEVANSLGLTNAAARQRLSRGREMLRNRVSSLIEGVLDRSNPKQTFTARVMAGIMGAGIAGHSATASAASVTSAAKTSSAVAAAKFLATGSLGGVLGGLIGIFGGLAGSWIGNWLPAQLAPTETERQLLLERARTTMRTTIVYIIALLSLTVALLFFPWQMLSYFFATMAVSMLYVGWVLYRTAQTQALVQMLRKELSPEEDPNQSKVGQRIKQQTSGEQQKLWGRKYTSTAKLFGIPLIDIQVSDPLTEYDPIAEKPDAKVAHGWIAVGDVAKGILLAVGGRAYGAVACGGFSVGIVSLGGLSIGLISMGGLALGLMAFGGGAFGYDAVGGAAIGWHSATGGGAIAYHAAAGGGALAKNFAVGGGAFAAEANTPAAHQVIEQETYFAAIQHPWLVTIVSVLAGVLPMLLTPFYYSRRPPEDGTADSFDSKS